MADQIGRISVPVPIQTSAVFPLTTDYGYGEQRDWKVVEFRFGSLATMAVQRYAVGPGARRFQFVKSVLSYADRQNLLDFYNQVQGSYQGFIYPMPNTDRQTFTNYNVVFDTPPVSITELANRAQTGLTFLEIIDTSAAPNLTVGSVCRRFPSSALAQALTSQVQVIIPLVHIRMRNAAVPDIWFSDRRVNVTGIPGAPTSPITYLPRLVGIGVPGTSDVIMSQSIDGRSDNVRFVFGNADRALSQLINDCSIQFAQIDLSFFHVQSNTLLQLWKGLIISWQIDGSPQMSVQCSDGLYPITQSYPVRTVSRQCWKPFNQDILPGYRPCPFATAASGAQGGDPNSCDYNYNSKNGCLSHGMSPYFGGHPEQPQSVVIRDNGTGIIGGFFRSTVTSTSILSDSIWGNPLPEIYCNDLGTAQRAFWAQCLVAAVRDESDYEDILGIVGVGPLGAYEGMSVQTNADGYKFVVAPTADGFFPQGLKVNAQLAITGYHPTLGLRQSLGNDPSHLSTTLEDGTDAFSLGQGTPQTWYEMDPTFWNIQSSMPGVIIPYAAGTAVTEIRYPKSSGTGLAPTTAESHNMQVPVRWGLTCAVFDYNGNRTLTPGCVNPFWVAANMYLRALGVQQATLATQLDYLVLDSITNAQGMGAADIAGLFVSPIVGTVLPGYSFTTAGQALTGYKLDANDDTFTYQDSSGNIVSMTIEAAISAGYVVITSQPNQEPQFQFQGTLAEFKPFRDWMNEVLNCTLGYFCFEFGKLYLGIRYSAVPTDSFNLGSMLYQSLTLTPISGAFEYLKVNFANVELQYQQDLAEYNDKDHALYFGRPGAPLTSSMRSVGCSTLSQGLRIAVSRTREETGGILRDDLSNPYIEWDNNKRATFKSTLLALNNEVGQVISITHPDVATYPGAHPNSRPGSNPAFQANTWPFRIKRWMLHSDWSVTIQADSCVDSMYDTDVGPQPQGVGPRPLPVIFFDEPLGEWAPYEVHADPADALYPGEWTFDLAQSFSYQGDGTLLTSAIIGGHLPVNQFVPNCGAVDAKKGDIARATTGGAIPGGVTLYLQLCATVLKNATDPSSIQQYSPPSEVLILQVPTGTNTNTITINDIVWPPVSSLNGWALFCNTIEDLICQQVVGLGLPTSITFTGPIQRSTIQVPDFDLARLRLRATHLIHGGVLGAGINHLTTTTITSTDTVDTTGQDNWAGRVLAIIGRQGNGSSPGDAPFAHFNITAFDPATGIFTVDRDPTAAGVQPLDIFVVCTLGVDNHTATGSNPYVIDDPGLSNATNIPPHTGEAVNDPTRVGQMVRVIAGTSRGKSAKIVSNTATSYTLDQPLPIDATSVWVVVDPGWQWSKDVVLNNADPSQTTFSALEINNYNGLALLCEGVNIDAESTIVSDGDACVRMLYIPGVQGTDTVVT